MKNQILILLVGLVFLTSCMTQKRYTKICNTCPVVVKRTDTFIQKDSTIVRDTFIKTEQDSATMALYLECINGKVVVKNSEIQQGHKTKQSYSLINNKLTADCKVDSGSVAFAWLENHKEHWKKEVIETQRPVPIELTKWQKFYLNIGKWGFWLGLTALGTFVFLEVRRRFF